MAGEDGEEHVEWAEDYQGLKLNLVLKLNKTLFWQGGKAVINGGWRWGWIFTGSCGPLLKGEPGQGGKVSVWYAKIRTDTNFNIWQNPIMEASFTMLLRIWWGAWNIWERRRKLMLRSSNGILGSWKKSHSGMKRINILTNYRSIFHIMLLKLFPILCTNYLPTSP